MLILGQKSIVNHTSNSLIYTQKQVARRVSYLHRVGHVVVGGVIDSREEVFAELQRWRKTR